MAHYIGIIDGSGDTWGVRFPDVPGCVGVGASPEDAIADATEALRDVMAYKRGRGLKLPEFRKLTEVLASGEVGRKESTVLIPLLLDTGREPAAGGESGIAERQPTLSLFRRNRISD